MIQAAQRADTCAWARMRDALWPSKPGEHLREIERFFAGESRDPLAVFIAFDEDGVANGFIELSIRPYAEGCATDRVAFVEGWYVDLPARGKGFGKALMSAAEAWARSQRCSELASNAEVENLDSAKAHLAVGFAEAGVVRCFKKPLLIEESRQDELGKE